MQSWIREAYSRETASREFIKCQIPPLWSSYMLKWSESCLVMSALWDPMDYTVLGILQPRILECE